MTKMINKIRNKFDILYFTSKKHYLVIDSKNKINLLRKEETQ